MSKHAGTYVIRADNVVGKYLCLHSSLYSLSPSVSDCVRQFLADN